MYGQDFFNLQEAYLEVYQELDEAEGSYGQTPQSTKRWNKATLSRMHKPASEYPNRGDKKKEVDKYSKHNQRTMALNHDASRGPGKKSSRGSGGRMGLKMTQKDRDDARGQVEYGHTGYDPDFDGPPSSPGSKPKGKKLERQKKTGVSAESFDIYDIILSHLLDEGYADTKQSAEVIMVNMSEEWRDDIMLEYVSPSMFSVSGGGSRSGPSERERKEQERKQRGHELRSRAKQVVDSQRRGSHGAADTQMSAQPDRKKDYDPNSGWAHYYDDSARGRATALRPRS